MAWRNSGKSIGYRRMRSTFPTGNESGFDVISPRRDPAHATCSSGISSAKYFSEVSADGTLWISSRISRVFPGTILLPWTISRLRTIASGSRSPSNRAPTEPVLSKFTYTMESNSFLPNSFSRNVFPH